MKDYLIFQEMEDNLKSSENISNLNYQLMPNISNLFLLAYFDS